MKVKIYVLIDPFTFKTRYIGRTKIENINNRLSQHISKAKYHIRYGRKASHLYNWINFLLKKNARPLIRLFATVEGWEISHQIERELIKKYSKLRDLTNQDDYGAGECVKVVSQDSRNLISNTLKDGYKSGRILPTRKKEIHAYDLMGIYLKSFESVIDASRKLNISYTSVSANLNGKARQAKGYRFTTEKVNNLPCLGHFRKGKVSSVKIKSKTKTLEFPSISECCRYFGISTRLTVRQHFVNTVQQLCKEACTFYIDGVKYRTCFRHKPCSLLLPDGTTKNFSNLQELGKFLNISKSHCYLNHINTFLRKNVNYKYYKLILE